MKKISGVINRITTITMKDRKKKLREEHNNEMIITMINEGLNLEIISRITKLSIEI